MENKQIVLDYEGKKYTLEYDRASITVMEHIGFNVMKMMQKPVTDISTLVEGAFIKHHRDVPEETVWAIHAGLKDKAGFHKALREMVIAVVDAMATEPADEKNAISWKLV